MIYLSVIKETKTIIRNTTEGENQDLKPKGKFVPKKFDEDKEEWNKDMPEEKIISP